MKILILAGGGGTRLWPLSRQDFPKQFLDFGDQVSLLQKTVGRFLRASFVDDVVVATNQQYLPHVEMQLEKIDSAKKAKILLEPARRNTAPAIALAVKYMQESLHAKDDDAILVMPSDHLIEPQYVFLQFVEEMENFAQSQIVLFGIRPTHPESGYGYIQIGDKTEGLLYQAKRFVEKPDRRLAEQYLASGDYYWNAGIFAFSPQVFWRELKECSPDIEHLMKGSYEECLAQFSANADISFDYAVLEKTKNLSICPIPISWSDVGSWDSLYDAMEKDDNQNVKMGNILDIDTKNSLIIGGKKLISTIGLEDVLIVETDDAMLISKKGESQKVKELVKELMKDGRKEVSVSSFHQYNWGNVKQLYTGEGFWVFCYQVHSQQSFTHQVPEGVIENWQILSGECEINDDKLSVFGSQQFSQPIQFTLKNTSDKMAEILLVSHERQNF